MFKFVDENDVLIANCTKTNFVDILKSKWDQLHDESDIFRYKVDLKERYLDSTYLLQLNPNRSSKRRTPEEINNICQPFNEHKFNFSKVSKEEILLHIIDENDDINHTTILINVSPISRYHSLICPSLSKHLPQVVTKESLQAVLNIMQLAQDRDIRVGFNSLCALASVNHLHYHLFVEPHDLPVESVKCRHLVKNLYYFVNYPSPAFCFQITKTSSNITEDIFKLISYLIKSSIAHNIFFTRGKNMEIDDGTEVQRVIIWPRKSHIGAKVLPDFNIAVCELSGWVPVYSTNCYENINRETLENELRKCSIENFELLCEQVKSLY